ncbi:MAG TPA: 16S rRNA (uracil(1498)-N(3))-methyltransferase [Pseudomonadales bacterium]
MRTVRVYTAQAIRANSTLLLEEAPSHHLGRVLRAKPGQTVVLFDGSGGEYPGRITAIDKHGVTVAVTAHNPVERERATALHLGLALIKPERFDWAIEKCTELGAAAITPLYTQYTDQKIRREQLDKKLQRWQQIAISACEQSGRNRIPVIHAPLALDEWLTARDEAAKFVADPSGLTLDQNTAATTAALLIGPEGGLTAEEVQAGLQAGFNKLALGPAILRAETAAITALTIIMP